MANYSSGDIQLNIRAFSSDTINSITATTKALRGLNTQLKKITNIDMRKTYNAFNQLTRIIDPFLNKLKEAEIPLQNFSNALNLAKVFNDWNVAEAKVSKIKAQTQKILQNTLTLEQQDIVNKAKAERARRSLEKINNETKNMKNNSESAGISFKKLFNLGKIYFLINYTKRLAQGLGGIVESAISYNETLNKFQVAMGSSYEKSLKFVNNMTSAFNLSSESVMNYMATFKNMLQSISNLGEDTTYQLSETLTRMAVDYASLFNVSIDSSMEQFQSVLSGQIRSIRTTSGYDVSDNTYYQIYQNLGGTKTQRQLDETEKRLLRIIALQQQMEKSGAVNDFAKTINETANQLKALGQTIKEAGMWIGQLTLKYLQPVIEKTLSFAVALREMTKSLAIANGYVAQDFGTGGLFASVEESATNADEAVENLKSNLLGFDSLNILGSDTTTSNETDYSLLTDQIKKYASGLDEVKNKASETAEKILLWLGYTKDLNGEWTKKGGLQNIDKILIGIKTTLGSLISFGVGYKIAKVIKEIMKIKKINKVVKSAGIAIKASAGTIAMIVGAIVIIAIAIKKFYQQGGKFKEMIDENVKTLKSNLTPLLKNIKSLISDIGKLIAPLIKIYLKNFKEQMYYVVDYAMKFVNTLVNVVGFLISEVKLIITPIKAIAEYASAFSKGINEGDWSKWSDTNKKYGTEFSNIFEDMEGFGKKILKSFVGIHKTIFELIKDCGKEYINYFTGVTETIINILLVPINFLIKGLNKISFSIPDWIPGLGGKSFGIDIPQIPKVDIPKLATGNVATSSTIAEFGEYPNAKNNPEITSPVSIMRDTFMEAQAPYLNVMANGFEKVVNAIDEKDMSAYMNGRKVSEAIYDDFKNVAIRKGLVMSR